MYSELPQAYNAVILDLDLTVFSTFHTGGLSVVGVFEEEQKFKKYYEDLRINVQQKDINRLIPFYNNPLQYINPTFMSFLHRCLENNIPVYIATVGHYSNAEIVNRAYTQWCENKDVKPIKIKVFDESNAFGDGSMIDGSKQTMESIQQDKKYKILNAVTESTDAIDIPRESILFIDDTAENYAAANTLGISVLEYSENHKMKIKKLDFGSITIASRIKLEQTPELPFKDKELEKQGQNRAKVQEL
ncbi:hypothetical protein L3V82_03935 [Thiotrichales bacterium 19S3-7]|nr:hypothetical protein [Thiotrichales bacterium 19S3-7]MCF6801824.1 hypothetical protein [Thiotrichales bacterium 19S3-11]